VADTRAQSILEHLDKAQRTFAYETEALLKRSAPVELAASFDTLLRQQWPLAEVGFVVAHEGQVLAPSPLANAQARQFRVENDRFLCSAESCEVFWNSPKGPINLAKLETKDAQEPTFKAKTERTVMPAKGTSDTGAFRLSAGETNFRTLVGDEPDGAFARFLQDKLHLMFWHRAANDPNYVFGVQVHLKRLIEDLRPHVELPPSLDREICLALLDDASLPVALSEPGFQPSAEVNAAALRLAGQSVTGAVRGETNGQRPVAHETRNSPAGNPALSRAPWKHPFVAASVSEVLPHWELAVYVRDPARTLDTARTLGLTFGLLIGLLLLAIAVGSWLIVSDLRRQLALARQKTDFVSNVSHELKTPLTSIRMFSEMLADGRVLDEAKRHQFLHIITAETARLTRLINNVLDFARLERGEKKYRFETCSAQALVRETVESYRPHLEAAGFTLRLAFLTQDTTIQADKDALAQVLVNLLSNAEKYSGAQKEVDVEVETTSHQLNIRVLDRGLGVPRGAEEQIFEQFHRAHDSLASGIQGSGLGLTLARQMTRQHGGEVRYQPRPGGGSAFSIELPCTPSTSVTPRS